MDNMSKSKVSSSRGSVAPTFNVCDSFLGVYNIQMNQSMAQLVIDALSSLGGFKPISKELYAFKRALINPGQAREYRLSKRYEQGHDGDQEYDGYDDSPT